MAEKQMTLAMESDSGFEKHHKTTRRDEFLAQMNRVVPRQVLCALIEPVYPKVGARGAFVAVSITDVDATSLTRHAKKRARMPHASWQESGHGCRRRAISGAG